MENAMNPSATSETRARLPTSSEVEKPSPSTCSAPRQYGPIKTPAMRYAVTDGSLNGLNTLVIRRPARSATDTVNNVFITCLFSHFSNPKRVYACLYFYSMTIITAFRKFGKNFCAIFQCVILLASRVKTLFPETAARKFPRSRPPGSWCRLPAPRHVKRSRSSLPRPPRSHRRLPLFSHPERTR